MTTKMEWAKIQLPFKYLGMAPFLLRGTSHQVRSQQQVLSLSLAAFRKHPLVLITDHLTQRLGLLLPWLILVSRSVWSLLEAMTMMGQYLLSHGSSLMERLLLYWVKIKV